MQKVNLLSGEKLSVSYGPRAILDNVTVGVSAGDRIGIVGKNGDGKSTLMNILAGRQTPDSGMVSSRNDARIGFLSQNDELDNEATVYLALFGQQESYEWAKDAKKRDVIDGLVSDIDLEATIKTLSGGQKRRVALASLLVHPWDVIMLDEPTNHLDVEGIFWLAQHLKKRWKNDEGAFLVVTHDRWFLDEISTKTWEVHDARVDIYEGGYAAYMLARAERDKIAAVEENKRQRLVKKELAWLRRGAPARTSKPKFRIEAANSLITDVLPLRDTLSLKKMAMQRLGKDVIDLEDVSYSILSQEDSSTSKNDKHASKKIFDNVTFRLVPGERVGIVGTNGTGKTTLFKLFMGEINPDSGRVKTGKTVKIALLKQETPELDEISDKRVAEIISDEKNYIKVEGKELSATQLLETFGFTGQKLWTKIGDLSGGEKRRLQLLRILMTEPNVLLLDEPTNDLDVETLTAIEDLMDSWGGTLVVISHDRYLLERISDRLIAVLGDGTLEDLPRGIDEFLDRRVAFKSQKVSDSRNEDTQEGETGQDTTEVLRLSSGQERALKKELARVDRRMLKMSEQFSNLETEMETASMAGDTEQLTSLNLEYENLKAVLEEIEMQWLEISEKLGD